MFPKLQLVTLAKMLSAHLPVHGPRLAGQVVEEELLITGTHADEGHGRG